MCENTKSLVTDDSKRHMVLKTCFETDNDSNIRHNVRHKTYTPTNLPYYANTPIYLNPKPQQDLVKELLPKQFIFR